MDRHGCRFTDAVALVTGSTHGIGRAVVERLAAEGATVVVNDAGTHDGPAVARAVRDAGSEATFVEADVSDPEAVERLVDRVVDDHGRVDVLVNNVGEHRSVDPTTASVADWRFVLDTDLRSAWLATAAASDAGLDAVVNVSSIHARQTRRGYFPYAVAKAGIEGLTRSLAVELGPAVRVNAVAPGDIVVDDPPPPDHPSLEVDDGDPLGRRGVPADVARVVAFLASDDAGYVTGAVVPVDGGRHATEATPTGR